MSTSPIVIKRTSDEIVALMDRCIAADSSEARQQLLADWKYERRYKPDHRHFKFIPMFAELDRDASELRTMLVNGYEYFFPHLPGEPDIGDLGKKWIADELVDLIEEHRAYEKLVAEHNAKPFERDAR